jgi:hypothetical protein
MKPYETDLYLSTEAKNRIRAADKAASATEDARERDRILNQAMNACESPEELTALIRAQEDHFNEQQKDLGSGSWGKGANNDWSDPNSWSE